MTTWINFRELREQLTFAAVMEAYGVEVDKRREGKHQGRCPLPTHSGGSRGTPFSVDLSKGIWRCFGCKAAGNILDFATRMEGLDPSNGADIRKVAMALQRRFFSPAASPQHQDPPSDSGAAVSLPAKEVVNAPLNFELKGLDATHISLVGFGFREETLLHFGVGVCQRGFLKGRIAIPIHDEQGQLLGYTGRLLREDEASRTNPLYLYPEPRDRDGLLHRFEMGLLVYNAHRITTPLPGRLFVADDYLLVWHLWENGVPAVAILTDVVSEAQSAAIARLSSSGSPVFVESAAARRRQPG